MRARLESVVQEPHHPGHGSRHGDPRFIDPASGRGAVEEAEGLWRSHGGELVWENPEEENCHVEVCVRDRADGRFVPGLTVLVTLVDEDGAELGTHEQPFPWHPWLYHYGRNWRVPRSGDYAVRVRIEPPGFPRHDHENGRRYAAPVEVEVATLRIEPGRKTV